MPSQVVHQDSFRLPMLVGFLPAEYHYGEVKNNRDCTTFFPARDHRLALGDERGCKSRLSCLPQVR